MLSHCAKGTLPILSTLPRRANNGSLINKSHCKMLVIWQSFPNRFNGFRWYAMPGRVKTVETLMGDIEISRFKGTPNSRHEPGIFGSQAGRILNDQVIHGTAPYERFEIADVDALMS